MEKIKSRVLKTEPVAWRHLEFIQDENFKEWIDNGNEKLTNRTKTNTAMTDYQKKIFEETRKNGQITKRQAVELIGGSYYCNADKHVGDVLSRMVNAGLLIRVKNGLFELGQRTRKDNDTIPENQLKLF